MCRKKLTWYQWFLKSWGFMLLIWLFMGFAVGTLVLLFPLRSWVNYVRENELDDTIEKIGVVVMMAFIAVASLMASYRLFRWHLSRKKALVTALSIIFPFAFAAASLALFMNPDLVNSGSESAAVSQQFTVGPYPTESRIRQLKNEGYTGIISLLHPAVVPFEPSLLSDEEAATKTLNIELVKAPMLPWIGDNSVSLKKIEDLVRSGKGKYYIHCYLGKDRVNVVKNLIARVGGNGSAVASELGATHRTFEKMQRFERGDIYRLATDVYMTPYPTDEEFLSFFLAGRVKSVVNLMDGGEKRNAKWIDKEQVELEKAGVTFRHYSTQETSGEKELNRIIDSALRLPRPLVIHRWNTRSGDTEKFRELFDRKTGTTSVNLATHVSQPD
jgi:protein tyrosine phosphatase (PTP) superfamily phosphohydrolase (DUF442 family)